MGGSFAVVDDEVDGDMIGILEVIGPWLGEEEAMSLVDEDIVGEESKRVLIVLEG